LRNEEVISLNRRQQNFLNVRYEVGRILSGLLNSLKERVLAA